MDRLLRIASRVTSVRYAQEPLAERADYGQTAAPAQQTPTGMTVKALIDLLSKEDPNAPVGVSMSNQNGWIQGIQGVKHDEHGTVCIDQTTDTLHEEEADIK